MLYNKQERKDFEALPRSIFFSVEVSSIDKIKVFTTKTCPWCTKLKEYLEQKEIEFENIDVAENREAAMEMVRKSGQMGVPVTQIGDKYIVGYNPDAIDEELTKQSNS